MIYLDNWYVYLVRLYCNLLTTITSMYTCLYTSLSTVIKIYLIQFLKIYKALPDSKSVFLLKNYI